MSKPMAENRFCGQCNHDTKHLVVLVRKESPYQGQKNKSLKDFFAGLLKGWMLGPFVAEMDEYERHLICEVCGSKTIQD